MSSKFIITFTFPSGQKYAASTQENKLAFTPIVGGQILNALKWDIRDQVDIFLRALEISVGPMKFEELKKLNMKVEEIKI